MARKMIFLKFGILIGAAVSTMMGCSGNYVPVSQLAQSASVNAENEKVETIYQEVSDRSATPTDFQSWTMASGSGLSLQEFRDSLALSSEAEAKIENLYREIFGREADAEGLANYKMFLKTQGNSIGAIRKIFYESPEYDALRASQAPRCEITIVECPANPGGQGTFIDGYDQANALAGVCESRAFDYFEACGGGLAKTRFLAGPNLIQESQFPR